MSDIIRIHKNDYGRDVEITIRNPDTGATMNVSDATGKTITVGRIGKTTKLVDSVALTWKTNGSDGIVVWTPESTELVTAGYYDAEIRLTYGAGLDTIRNFTLHIVEIIG